jgi:hypothetical protein
MKYVYFISVIFSLTSCFKNEPKRETLMAAGSWKIVKTIIQENDESGNKISENTIENVGFLMLSHVDDYLYEGTYSYSLDSDKLNNSIIYDCFKKCNQWGITNGAKVLNLAIKDPSTGYSELWSGLTINKLTRKKFEIQSITLNSGNETIKKIEKWYMISSNK